MAYPIHERAKDTIRKQKKKKREAFTTKNK